MGLSELWAKEAKQLESKLSQGADTGADKVLNLLLTLSIISLGLRALVAAVANLRSPAGPDGELGATQPRLMSLAIAAGNVAGKIGGTFSHGLLAIKLVVADEPAGLPLAASILFVAATTQLLTSAAIVAHMRNILVKMALAGKVHLEFSHVTDVWHVPVGRVCLFFNALATTVLIVHLFRHPQRLCMWLATSAGFMMWATASFKGIGLMGLDAWRQVSPLIKKASRSVDVPEFMEMLGFEAATEASQDGGASAMSMLKLEFGKVDMLILRHRQALLRRAFPDHPWLRRTHGMSIVLFSLLSSAVPAILVLVCMRHAPQLQAAEVDGDNAFLSPDFVPSVRDYHILLQDAGRKGSHSDKVVLNFDIGNGDITKAYFCCDGGTCDKADMKSETDRKDQLTWKHNIQEKHFGRMCQLSLFGLQTGRYNFKVLAVNSLDFNESPSKEFEPVELSPLALSPYQQKYTATGVVLDAPRPVSWILSAKTSSSFAASKDGRTKLKDSANISHNSKNVQTNLVLHSSAAKVAASVTYSVNLTLVPLSQHIRTLAATIDSLERQRKAVQGEDGQEELDDDLDNRLEEWNHFRGKAWELKKRKKAKKAENSHQRRLTFVTLGNTGTGKSELCRWMTMDDPKCETSAKMTSHTSKVIVVDDKNAFGDETGPPIEWIDTPGRGDTRGIEEDDKLWNQTKTFLLDKGARKNPLHRIVWVVNAAWQRGTEERNNIFRQLRMTFGFHLYEHLVIAFNRMKHTGNETMHKKALEDKRKSFTDWMMEREQEEFKWPEEFRKGIQEEVNHLVVYGFDINPRSLEEANLPEKMPLSAPYVDLLVPLSHPAGLSDLKRLVKDADEHRKKALRDKKPEAEGLFFEDPAARFGPGQLHEASAQKVACGQWALSGDFYEFVPVVTVKLQGEKFMPEDGAFIVPSKYHCKKYFDGGVPSDIDILTPMETSDDRTVAFLKFPLANKKVHHSFRVCFCEFPVCERESGWRFRQSIEFNVTGKVCQPPTERLAQGRQSTVELDSVGSRLIGMDTNNDGLRLLDIRPGNGDTSSEPDVTEIYIKESCSDTENCEAKPDMSKIAWKYLLPGNDRAFAVDEDLRSILIITPREGILDTSDVSLQGFSEEPKVRTSILWDDEHLWFLTSTASKFCIHFLKVSEISESEERAAQVKPRLCIGATSVTMEVEVGCRFEQAIFLGATGRLPETEGPKNYVLARVGLSKAQGTRGLNLDEAACGTQVKGIQALVGFRNHLYAAQEGASRILVVDTGMQKCRSLDTSHLAEAVTWGGFAVLSDRIYVTPKDGLGDLIGVLEPNRTESQVKGIRVEGVSASIAAWPAQQKICLQTPSSEVFSMDVSTLPETLP